MGKTNVSKEKERVKLQEDTCVNCFHMIYSTNGKDWMHSYEVSNGEVVLSRYCKQGDCNCKYASVPDFILARAYAETFRQFFRMIDMSLELVIYVVVAICLLFLGLLTLAASPLALLGLLIPFETKGRDGNRIGRREIEV